MLIITPNDCADTRHLTRKPATGTPPYATQSDPKIKQTEPDFWGPRTLHSAQGWKVDSVCTWYRCFPFLEIQKERDDEGCQQISRTTQVPGKHFVRLRETEFRDVLKLDDRLKALHVHKEIDGSSTFKLKPKTEVGGRTGVFYSIHNQKISKEGTWSMSNPEAWLATICGEMGRIDLMSHERCHDLRSHGSGHKRNQFELKSGGKQTWMQSPELAIEVTTSRHAREGGKTHVCDVGNGAAYPWWRRWTQDLM